MAQQFVQMVAEVTFRLESHHGVRGPATPASRLSTRTLLTSIAGSARTVEDASEFKCL